MMAHVMTAATTAAVTTPRVRLRVPPPCASSFPPDAESSDMAVELTDASARTRPVHQREGPAGAGPYS